MIRKPYRVSRLRVIRLTELKTLYNTSRDRFCQNSGHHNPARSKIKLIPISLYRLLSGLTEFEAYMIPAKLTRITLFSFDYQKYKTIHTTRTRRNKLKTFSQNTHTRYPFSPTISHGCWENTKPGWLLCQLCLKKILININPRAFATNAFIW